ncbi:hypothetical protein [Streptomyces sirii]|uniref:hypothetical protein n=1 Tax=Streptomyces sirii TaxID=3127701 RepID=UPI003D36B48A
MEKREGLIVMSRVKFLVAVSVATALTTPGYVVESSALSASNPRAAVAAGFSQDDEEHEVTVASESIKIYAPKEAAEESRFEVAEVPEVKAKKGDKLLAHCKFTPPEGGDGDEWYTIEGFYYGKVADFEPAENIPSCPMKSPSESTGDEEPAQQFGTINTFGQDAEHEKVTRAALHCPEGVEDNDYSCLRDATLGQFAGGGGTFGAVGNPDNPLSGWGSHTPSHCDDMDYMSTYENKEEAKKRSLGALKECVDHMWDNLETAVHEAGRLADPKGKLVRGEMWTPVIGTSCVFVRNFSGEAKCNVLEALGAAAHAYQDFYSHSNWSDDSGGTTVDDPPPLNKAKVPSFLNFKTGSRIDDPDDIKEEVTEGFSGGCFDLNEKWFMRWFDWTNDCVEANRVTHMTINKDEGTIDPNTGETSEPRTERGKKGDNFKNAVHWAMETTKQNWLGFIGKVNEAYPEDQAETIACAMSHDNPDVCEKLHP